MKTIRISAGVWEKIAELGKFGETPDAVLRRVLGVTEEPPLQPRMGTFKHPDRATRTMSCGFNEDNELVVRFHGGEEQKWPLPDRSDHEGIRKVRDQAVEMATQNGASFGQIAALRKTLTANQYFVRPPKKDGGIDHLIA